MNKIRKHIFILLKKVWYYFWGKVFSVFLYKKKYLRGKWFQGKLKGLCSMGWQWIVKDAIGNFLLNTNKGVPWPVSPRTTVIFPENIDFDPDDLNNFQGFGSYFQGFGKISIGKGTWIAGNVGIITANHTVKNLELHDSPKPIIIGKKCWIGMNSVILPGVVLGDNTIVGAGSIVTKSFPKGNCVVAGNPARIIKYIDENGRRYNEATDFKQDKK